MVITRRKFIQAGSAIAIAAGIPMRNALSISGQPQTSAAPAKSANGSAPTPAIVKSEAVQLYSKASFQTQLNSTFRLQSKRSKAAEVKLVEIRDIGPVPDRQVSGRECFSLRFRGAPKLPQDTYTMTNSGLGTFTLLLVPMNKDQKDKKGAYYEAVINRLN